MRRVRPLFGLLVLALVGPSVAHAAPDPILMSLDEALSVLDERSPTLAQLVARVDEARGTVRLATAAALPMLAAQGGFTRNNAEATVDIKSTFEAISAALPIPGGIDTSGLPGALVIQPLQVWTAGAQLTVPLIDATAWTNILAAKAGANATEAQSVALFRTLETAVVRAAWWSGAAAAQVEAALHAEDVAIAHADTAARRHEAGLGTELEALAARVERDRRSSDRLQAEADLAKSQRALGALIGVGGLVHVRLPALTDAAAPNTESAVSHALAFRPELRASEWSWKAAHRQATSAWLRHLPTVSANGSLAAQTVNFPTGLPNAWRVGVSATWVLYDGGARYGLLKQAHAREDAAEAQRDQAKLDAERDAGDAVDALLVARARRVLAASALETADAAEAAASRAYEAGLINGTDLIEAQQRRYDAALAQAAADAQTGVAGAELWRTTGLGR